MVMELEFTVNGLAQTAFEVKVQLITSPFTIVVLVKVALVAPGIAVPFFFHT
jgi:hypothetical protein